MKRPLSWMSTLALAVFVGCGGSEPAPEPTTPAPAINPDTVQSPDPAVRLSGPKPVDVSAITLSEEEIAAIKELPEEDQALALAQKICPVGEEDGQPNHLGSMGKPVKVEAEGKVAFLCCNGCKEDFDKNPKAAFAKLGK